MFNSFNKETITQANNQTKTVSTIHVKKDNKNRVSQKYKSQMCINIMNLTKQTLHLGLGDANYQQGPTHQRMYFSE